jgi:hypothetical protein
MRFHPLLRALALGLAVLMTVAPVAAVASSHSEAPGTSKDRLIDDTDLYAWVSPDAPDMVTIVGNWIPLIEPNGGPNFAAFDDDADYYINIDNVGDARHHIRFEFEFKTTSGNGKTFLYNTGPVNALTDATLNVRQTYTVTRYDNGAPTVLASSSRTDPSYCDSMYCGLYETAHFPEIAPAVGSSSPASIFTNVVFPVAFAPTTPTTSPFRSTPPSTSSVNPSYDFVSFPKWTSGSAAQVRPGGRGSNRIGRSRKRMFSSFM